MTFMLFFTFEELGSNFENKILEFLKKFNPEVIVLAGFMHILSKNFLYIHYNI